MTKPVTIAQLEADVRWQADQERADLRHTTDALRRIINKSILQYREKVSENGDPSYLVSKSGTLTPGQASDPNDDTAKFQFGLLDTRGFDPAVVRVYGFDVVTGTNQTVSLQSVGFNERNLYQDSWSPLQFPVAFFGYDGTKLGILPAPDSAYRYTLWYLPEEPLLLQDTDEFDPVIPGGEQWVVWDAMTKIFLRDNYPHLYGMIVSERDRTWADIMRRISSHSRVSVARRLDTRWLRRRSLFRGFRGWL